jgi:hypothetical protein
VNPSTKNIMTLFKLFKPSLRLLSPFLLLAASSCDVLKVDEIDDNQTAFDSKIYVLADAPTTFDLQSRVKSIEPVTIKITARPGNGDLNEDKNGLYNYVPKGNERTDSFEISVTDGKGTTSNNTFQLIRLGQNDTAPCGAIARDDNYYGFSNGATDLNVIENDVVNACGGQIELSMYRPQPNYPPYEGTVEIVNGKIHYVPKASFIGYDKFFYQIVHISSTGERSAPSYGRVYISNEAPCTLALNDDSFQFTLGSIGNAVKFNAAANDVLCKANNDYSFEMPQSPTKGVVTGGPDVGFVYKLPEGVTGGFSDSFVYKVCVDGTCDDARVTLTFTGNVPSCAVRAVEDNFSTVGSSLTEFQFAIFANDNMCGESRTSATIVSYGIQVPTGPITPATSYEQYISQFARIENGMLYYKPAKTTDLNFEFDEIEYEVVTNTGKVTRATVKIRRK